MLKLLIFSTLLTAIFGALLHEENFDKDLSQWEIEIVANPHNSELQYYTDRSSNIRVENGNLVITPLKENYGGKSYTSGRMHSKFYWKYGRVEIRAKLPNGYGLWPAIWMMPQFSEYGGWPTSGEIDIMEARGYNLNEYASTIHYGICCDEHYYESGGDKHLDCSIDQFHVYSLDWTPTELVYGIDGITIHRHSLDRVISYMYDFPGQPFDKEFHLILNVAVGGHYLDDPKPNTVWDYPEATMMVDYVKVHPLEDIATGGCYAGDWATQGEVCAEVHWACYNQNYADVSQQCTSQLMSCCNSLYSCKADTLNSLASNVFTAYDNHFLDGQSCIFNGVTERVYSLTNPDPVFGSEAECYLSYAPANEICGAVLWACNDQSYADVTAECSAGGEDINCCYSSASSCNYNTLHAASEDVFQAYYHTIPSSSSCDFGGICYLEGGEAGVPCTDGYQ